MESTDKDALIRLVHRYCNNTGWDYIETKINGKTARGFVPSGTLSITGRDITETGAYLLEIEGDG